MRSLCLLEELTRLDAIWLLNHPLPSMPVGHTGCELNVEAGLLQRDLHRFSSQGNFGNSNLDVISSFFLKLS